MAIDDVALGDEIGAPDRVENLVPRDHSARSAREEVEQALLDPAQVDDRFTGPDLPIHDVDLDIADGLATRIAIVRDGRLVSDEPGSSDLRRRYRSTVGGA